MGVGETIINNLKNHFSSWNFSFLNYFGLSGGLITGWSSKLILINSFAVNSGLCTELFSKRLGQSLFVVNVYKSYSEGQNFWDIFFPL